MGKCVRRVLGFSLVLTSVIAVGCGEQTDAGEDVGGEHVDREVSAFKEKTSLLCGESTTATVAVTGVSEISGFGTSYGTYVAPADPAEAAKEYKARYDAAMAAQEIACKKQAEEKLDQRFIDAAETDARTKGGWQCIWALEESISCDGFCPAGTSPNSPVCFRWVKGSECTEGEATTTWTPVVELVRDERPNPDPNIKPAFWGKCVAKVSIPFTATNAPVGCGAPICHEDPPTGNDPPTVDSNDAADGLGGGAPGDGGTTTNDGGVGLGGGAPS